MKSMARLRSGFRVYCIRQKKVITWIVKCVECRLIMFSKQSLGTYCFYSVSYYVPQTKFGNIFFLLCFLLLLLLFFFFYFLLSTFLSASCLRVYLHALRKTIKSAIIFTILNISLSILRYRCILMLPLI